MEKNIKCKKINNECIRFHFFKVMDGKGNFLGYEMVRMDEKFPKPLKYSDFIHRKGL